MSELSLRELTVVRRLPLRAQVGASAPRRDRGLQPQAAHSLVRDRGRRSARRTARRQALLLPQDQPRSAQVAAYRRTPARRGRDRHVGFRIATRFPFGLFEKSREVRAEGELIIYPAVDPVQLPSNLPGERLRRQLCLRSRPRRRNPIACATCARATTRATSTGERARAQLIVRERAREARRDVSYVIDSSYPGPVPTKSGAPASNAGFATSLRARSLTSNAAMASRFASQTGERVRATSAVGADPVLRFLALLEAKPSANSNRRAAEPRSARWQAEAGMRFGLIHRIMTDSLAALGLLALITSGELNHWLTIAVLVGLAGAVLMPESWQDRPLVRKIAVVLPLALLGVQVLRFFSGASLLEIAVEFAAGFQVIRLATRRGAAHDQQIIVLALLHFVAGTVLGGGLAYGLCFLGFLVVAPGALVLSHLRREVEGNYRQGARDRTGLPVDVPRILRSRRVVGRSFLVFTCLLSVPIFLFTAALFVAFPRVGLSLLLLSHPKAERMVGFTERVDLGGVGRLRSDPTIVMRVEVPNLPKEPPPRVALYLRGAAFDNYRGKSWSRSAGGTLRAEQHGRQVQVLRFPDLLRDRAMHIDLEPIEPPVVFLPPEAVALTVAVQGASLLNNVPQISAGPEGSLTYKTQDERGLRYDVSLAAADEPDLGRAQSG